MLGGGGVEMAQAEWSQDDPNGTSHPKRPCRKHPSGIFGSFSERSAATLCTGPRRRATRRGLRRMQWVGWNTRPELCIQHPGIVFPVSCPASPFPWLLNQGLRTLLMHTEYITLSYWMDSLCNHQLGLAQLGEALNRIYAKRVDPVKICFWCNCKFTDCWF
jgi:hypothetical protein